MFLLLEMLFGMSQSMADRAIHMAMMEQIC